MLLELKWIRSAVPLLRNIFYIFLADWWDQYGGDYPDLQYFAKRIVSQCMSSSGCERNWSTFALVHTKLRNRLSYDKLHKLVYVHYNLKLRIQLFQDEMQSLQDMQCHLESDSDPCSILMDCAMYEASPHKRWLKCDTNISPRRLIHIYYIRWYITVQTSEEADTRYKR